MKKFNHPFALFKKKLQSKKISEWYEKKNRLIVIILPNKPKTPTETYIINRHTHKHTFNNNQKKKDVYVTTSSSSSYVSNIPFNQSHCMMTFADYYYNENEIYL